ncbi:MAG: aspartate kinase [Armatimonadetes bacterium]|nr:aspartate kinase [Armatimonadota bacterium]
MCYPLLDSAQEDWQQVIVVQKYGGSSVATTEKIAAVAKRVAERAKEACVVVVVSAMGDTTDELISMARQLSSMPEDREMDKLLATGEQASSALLAMAMHDLGIRAVSLTGGQAGIITERTAGRARILKIDVKRLREELNKQNVVVVAGFQGITENASWADITTLGRGGSDTTAVALAAALKADSCEIFTDVDGVYTADPRIEADARKLDTISYEEMLEMAGQGARVMHSRAVELGELYDVDILVANSTKDVPGTVIKKEDDEMEVRNPVRGIAHDTDVTRITVAGVPDQPGIASRLFATLAHSNINVDVIVQNVGTEGLADVSFTVQDADLEKAKKAIGPVTSEIEAREVVVDQNVAKVSIVGSGIRSNPGYAEKMFTAFAAAEINILSITTSEIRITCLIARNQVKNAVRALHRAFELEKA